MQFNLTDKVAVVTGGGSGIALEIVRSLAAEGAHVVTADRDVSALRHLKVTTLEADLLDPRSSTDLVRLAADTHGRIDILVNAVGAVGLRTDGFENITDDDWRWTMDLNLMCMVRTTRAAIPYLLDSRGSIVSIASDAGRQPDPVFCDYGAAKAGVISLSKSLSLEYAARGVRSNVVSPGPTRTPGFLNGMDEMASEWGITQEQAIDRFVNDIRHIPMRTLADVQDIANVVCFLASDLTRHVTGSEYCVDGGIIVGA